MELPCLCMSSPAPTTVPNRTTSTGCILRVCSYFYWKRNNYHWHLSLIPVFQVVTPSVTPSSWSQDLPSPKIPWSWTRIICVFQISCYAFKSIISLGVFECRFVTVPVSMRGIYSFLMYSVIHILIQSVNFLKIYYILGDAVNMDSDRTFTLKKHKT